MTLQSLHTSTLSSADHLRLDGISRSFPERRVLTDISLTVASGEVAALIGENGSGKSTLLRIAAGLDEPDAGSLQVPGTVGLFHQEPPFSLDLSIAEVLADATAPLHELARRVEREGQVLAQGQDGAATRLQEAIEAAERQHAWDLEHRIDRVVAGLGLADLPRERRASALSGGQLSRLSLAWLLLRSPDTLLLDEPTNHLDDAATQALVELLAGWSGPVLIASHDRAFLDEVATTLLDLDPAPLPFATVRQDRDSPAQDVASPGSPAVTRIISSTARTSASAGSPGSAASRPSWPRCGTGCGTTTASGTPTDHRAPRPGQPRSSMPTATPRWWPAASTTPAPPWSACSAIRSANPRPACVSLDSAGRSSRRWLWQQLRRGTCAWHPHAPRIPRADPERHPPQHFRASGHHLPAPRIPEPPADHRRQRLGQVDPVGSARGAPTAGGRNAHRTEPAARRPAVPGAAGPRLRGERAHGIRQRRGDRPGTAHPAGHLRTHRRARR